MRNRTVQCLVVAACLAASAGVLERAQPTLAAQVFRAQSDLVVLQVAVHNNKSEPVGDLTQGEFRVWEDGVLQDIRFFGNWDQPIAIGLVVDNSASMMPKRKEVVEAAQAFVQASRPDDAVFTVNFNDRVSFGLPDSIPFSSDLNVLQRAVGTIGASGQTAMYDAIAAGLERIGRSTLDQRVLVLISDGDDNRSRLPYKDVLQRAMASSAVIYAVGIFDPIEGGNEKVLRELAKATGGVAFFPEKIEEIRQVLDRISFDVRRHYTLGYVSTNATRDGAFRKIKVQAVDRERRRALETRARSGYIAGNNLPTP